MADLEILNLHSKKTAFGQNSKLKILPVRCQTNTLLKSEGKWKVNFLIIVRSDFKRFGLTENPIPHTQQIPIPSVGEYMYAYFLELRIVRIFQRGLATEVF